MRLALQNQLTTWAVHHLKYLHPLIGISAKESHVLSFDQYYYLPNQNQKTNEFMHHFDALYPGFLQ